MQSIRRSRRPKGDRRRGIVAVLVALLLVVLLGVTAFSIDGGGLYDLRRRASGAAEAAASAAALELLYPSGGVPSESKAIAAAHALAAANGFPNDGDKSDVVVHIPPTSGAFAGREGFIEVIVHGYRDRTFSSVFGGGRLTVTGRAVVCGGYVPTKASILVLDPTKKKAASIDDAYLDLGGDLIINSKNQKALSLKKKSQVKAENIVVAGGVERTKKQDYTLDGDLSTNAKPTPDPLAGMPVPEDSPTLKADSYKKSFNGVDHFTLEPGTYGDLKFDSDDAVVFKPGVYRLEGVLEVKQQATITAEGVTLFSVGGKDMKFSSDGTLYITPPKTGPYAGISLVSATNRKIAFKSTGDLQVSGTIYNPYGEVRFQQTDAVLKDMEEDTEWETADGGYVSSAPTGSINAQIIAGRFKVDKKSHITIRGNGIAAERPFYGIVE